MARWQRLDKRVEYGIDCKCNAVEWTVWRRFSAFTSLNDLFEAEEGGKMNFKLPSKPFKLWGTLKPEVIENLK